MSEDYRLLNLNAQAHQLTQMILSMGQENTEEMENELIRVQIGEGDAVDNTVFLLNYLEQREAYYRDAAAECSLKARKAAEVRSKIKERIKLRMMQEGRQTWVGRSAQFTVAKSTPSLHILDESLIPELYKVKVLKQEIEKELLKKDLKDGLKVPGAHLEPNFSLRTLDYIPQLKGKK